MLGGGRGSLTPVLLEENDRLAPEHRHSGSNSAADLATPVEAYVSIRRWFSLYWLYVAYFYLFNVSLFRP